MRPPGRLPLPHPLRAAGAARLLQSHGGGIAGVGTYEAVAPEGEGLNKYSAVITQRITQGAGQAQLYATDVGKIKDGMNKPQVGIASVWYEGNPCNMHLLDIAGEVKQQVQAVAPLVHQRPASIQRLRALPSALRVVLLRPPEFHVAIELCFHKQSK